MTDTRDISALSELRERLSRMEKTWRQSLREKMREEALKTLIVGAPSMSTPLRESLATAMATKAVGCVSSLLTALSTEGG